MKMIDPGLTDPNNEVPSFAQLEPHVQLIWKRIFTVGLGLNLGWLSTAEQGTTIPSRETTQEARITISKPAFFLSTVLIGLNLVMAVIYYYRIGKNTTLPRMPITIERIMELFDGSRLIEEHAKTGGLDGELEVGYGRFMGTDGREHEGIERAASILPDENPEPFLSANQQI